MKVIVASYSKTGTKTINAVLKSFGYTVYDWMEHVVHHGDDWRRILESGGSLDDFKRMYKGVDAVVDVPASLFWEQILEAYPDAKVILTVRDEKKWLESLRKQVHSHNNSQPLLLHMFSYTGWKIGYFDLLRRVVAASYGLWRAWPWSSTNISSTVAIRLYRQHNLYVLKKTPKDQLLLVNLEDGWKPICDFLGEKIPQKPFPHENKKASLFTNYIKSDPVMSKMARESNVMVYLLIATGAFVISLLMQKIYKYYM